MMSHKVRKSLSLLPLLALLFVLAGCYLNQSYGTGVVIPTSPAPSGAYLYKVFMLSAQEGWATGATFSVTGSPQKAMLAHYTGGAWQEVPVNTPLFSLYFTDPSNGWAVGLGGTIIHYDGTVWSSVRSPTKAVLRDVILRSATVGWAIGDRIILHYDGQHWTGEPTSARLMSLSLVSVDEGWAVGENGVILHLGGDQWISVPSPTSQDLNNVFMVSSSDGWAVGANGTVLHYNGSEWSLVQGTGSTGGYSVSMSSATNGWASGEDGRVMHYQGGRWTINTQDTIEGYDLSSIAMVSAAEGWAVGQKNIIRHYQQGTWSTFATLP